MFADRSEGRMLATLLAGAATRSDVVVLVPCRVGGVPVVFEVAGSLDVSLRTWWRPRRSDHLPTGWRSRRWPTR